MTAGHRRSLAPNADGSTGPPGPPGVRVDSETRPGLADFELELVLGLDRHGGSQCHRHCTSSGTIAGSGGSSGRGAPSHYSLGRASVTVLVVAR